MVYAWLYPHPRENYNYKFRLNFIKLLNLALTSSFAMTLPAKGVAAVVAVHTRPHTDAKCLMQTSTQPFGSI